MEFLDSVLESTRSKEAEVRKDTKQQLDAFRKQQEDAEKVAKQVDNIEEPPATESWALGPRKRKKGKEREGLGGVKLKKMSTSEAKEAAAADAKSSNSSSESPQAEGAASEVTAASSKSAPQTAQKTEVQVTHDSRPAAPAKGPSLGLAAYSSDEEN